MRPRCVGCAATGGVDGGLAAAITARDSSTDRTDRSESYDEAEDEESEGHVRSGRFGSQWNNDDFHLHGLDETDYDLCD